MVPEVVMSTSEMISIFLLIGIFFILYWRAERENCVASLQQLLSSFALSDEEKEATMSKLDAEHIPLARHMLTMTLLIVLMCSVSIDCAFTFTRSSSMQLYLDYTFYACCLLGISLSSRSYISADTLYSMGIISIFFGMGHSLVSEPTSILLMTPIKGMQSLCGATLLADHVFSALACTSALVDFCRLWQYEHAQGVLYSVAMTQLGSGVLSTIWMLFMRAYIMKEPEQPVPPVADSHEVSQFFHEHSAARRMLAVLCDAQVYLNQDLNIVSHCRGLAQLLMSTNSAKCLEGRLFDQFLAPRDRTRFQAFVESAVQAFMNEEVQGAHPELVPSSGWKRRTSTPSSIQVHVMDSHGLLVAVELFHICVPGPDHERGHFIGITEAENSLSSHASFSDSGSANSFNSQLAATAGQQPNQNAAFQEIFAFKPPVSEERQLGPSSSDFSKRDEIGNEDCMSTSGSSESSVTSANGLVGKMRACPEIDYGEITVDAFCDRLSIKEAFFRFGKQKSNDGPPAPSILEWVWPSTRDRFHAAMSHGVNLLFAPPEADLGRLEKKFEPIMFQLPFKNKSSYALVANEVDLVFADRQAEGDEQRSEDGQEDVLVKLKLSNFMVKRLTPSKPQKIKELEERAKARADMVRTQSLTVSSTGRSQGSGSEMRDRLVKGRGPPSATDSEKLEPIQEVTNRRRRREIGSYEY